jgi:hypothetical protein
MPKTERAEPRPAHQPEISQTARGAVDLPAIRGAPARLLDRLATGTPRGSVPTDAGSSLAGLTRVRGSWPRLPRKEVIQPQLPLRLPCYDFVPITSPALDGCLPTGNPPGWPTGFRRCRLS